MSFFSFFLFEFVEYYLFNEEYNLAVCGAMNYGSGLGFFSFLNFTDFFQESALRLCSLEIIEAGVDNVCPASYATSMTSSDQYIDYYSGNLNIPSVCLKSVSSSGKLGKIFFIDQERSIFILIFKVSAFNQFQPPGYCVFLGTVQGG